MKKKMVKSFIVLLSAVVLLSGCGVRGVADSINNQYPFESVVTGEGSTQSMVYRAKNQSVQEVAKNISDQASPKETSKGDSERMFLVYKDQLVHIMEDTKKPTDTLIEVSEKEFVRRNYSTSFLETYLMFRIVDSVFGMGGIRRDQGYGGYIGSGGRYSRDAGNGGSIRYGSVGANNPRGGGPGVGK